MTALIGWLIGGAGQIVAGILVALITALGLYARGRADAAARAKARADRAALDTIGRIRDAQDDAAAGGAGWHERLRRTGDD